MGAEYTSLCLGRTGRAVLSRYHESLLSFVRCGDSVSFGLPGGFAASILNTFKILDKLLSSSSSSGVAVQLQGVGLQLGQGAAASELYQGAACRCRRRPTAAVLPQHCYYGPVNMLGMLLDVVVLVRSSRSLVAVERNDHSHHWGYLQQPFTQEPVCLCRHRLLAV